ncbi:MAG: diguanylate cyclase, partial [Rhodobacterales bacterium]|nr:diguanylate cyclase [Rhodobacterales bacterium]
TRDSMEEARAVDAARARWRSASAFLGSIESLGAGGVSPGNHRAFEAFETDVLETARQLKAVTDGLGEQSEQAFDEVMNALTWTELISLIALILSILMTVIGIQLIYRTLVASMDELSEGALRIAEGDRNHKVDVTIPMELASVADTFNRMTEKILEQEKALVTAASVDSLTGLYNRREFDRVLEDEVKRSLRYGTSVALVLVDIDHFKKFNDTHGHQGGDEALRTVAETLMDGIRRVDKAFRYGGEELAVVLPSSDLETAAQTAERLRAAIEEKDIELPEGGPAQVTVSLGVAVCPDQAQEEERLVEAADEALYEAKESGRNRVVKAPVS